MPKHGNWNARPDFAPLGVVRERRDKQFAAVLDLARKLFDTTSDSDLSEAQQESAVALFNVFWARLREK